MEKRYQVFISSTFQDLEGARQEVSQALLRADCFPAGMELFPAADEEQFEFIKQVIQQSDYYIIISAGRYGSIHPETGLSYTEMEYDYAVEIGIPLIRMLHKDPKAISDEGDEKLASLLKFRTKLRESRMVAFWESADQLGKEVTFALLDLKKSKPAIGWVRADGIATEDAAMEIAKLKQRLAEQSLEIERIQNFNGHHEIYNRCVSIVERAFSSVECREIEKDENIFKKIVDRILATAAHSDELHSHGVDPIAAVLSSTRVQSWGSEELSKFLRDKWETIKKICHALAAIDVVYFENGSLSLTEDGSRIVNYNQAKDLFRPNTPPRSAP